MADQTERLRVIIEADGTATLSDGTRLAADQVRKLGEELSRTGKEAESTGKSSEQAARHIAGLGRDISQGDWRGAALNMGRLAASTGAMEAASSGLGVALGAGAAALAVWLAISRQVSEETERQANALLLTGNYAGLVSGELNAMARSTAATINSTVGGTRETMEGLAASGRVTRQTLTEMASAVELVAQFSGRTRADVVKDFAGMADGVATWAAKHNESWHFITFEQYKYIESLEKADRAQEAMRVTSEALSQHLGGDLTRNLGTLQRAWQGVRNFASQAWDAMLNVGREQTTAERITAAEQAVQRAEKRLQAARNAGMLAGGSGAQKALDDAKAELEAASEVARLERRAADEQSRRAQEEEAKIAKDREKTKKGPKDTTYENLNQQIQRRLELAKAEEEQGTKLAASESYRLSMLSQIADAESKIGPQRANQLRLLVDETAEVLRNNEATAEALKNKKAAEAAALKEYQAQEQEIQGIVRSNEALELQIASVGKTKSQIELLKAERLDHAIALREEQLATVALFDASSPRLEQIQREIDALKQKRDLTAKLSQVEKVDEQRKKNEAESKKFGEDLRRDVTRGLMRGFESGKDLSTALADTLANTIQTRVTRALAEALLNPILKPMEQSLGGLTGSFASLFGNASTASTYGTNIGSQQTAMLAEQDAWFAGNHEGGIAGREATFSRAVSPRLFAAANRFHTGGITGDEVPIIAKRGEGVFTPGQMKAIGAGMSGGGMAMMNVTVVNNTGGQVAVRQRQGNGGMDMELVLDMVDSSMADRVGAGVGALPRAMESRYGLRTAVN